MGEGLTILQGVTAISIVQESTKTSSSKWLHRIAVGGTGEESLPRIHDLEAPQGVELHAMIDI